MLNETELLGSLQADTGAALALSFAMGVVILFCRVFPFILFRERPRGDGINGKEERKSAQFRALLTITEKIMPPAAMTVLAFNALTLSIKSDISQTLPAIAASIFTALLHLWKRNSLLSIVGGTILYILLMTLR
ncbi:MAG: AzlD domain-containing protein [Treponema sp.]|jgi:branched-subunit amino acid transport protein AzlD|nr:AzlD domain-containing protein [Treponema sp.]